MNSAPLKLVGVVGPNRPRCHKSPSAALDDPERTHLVLNGHAMQSLTDFLADGDRGLKSIPAVVKAAILNGTWKQRIHPRREEEVFEFDRFEDFVAELPLEGLGTTIDHLKDICRDDEEAVRLICQETVGSPGGNRNPEGINQHSPRNEVITDNISNDLPEPFVPIPELPLFAVEPEPAEPNQMPEPKPRRNKHGTSREYALQRLEENRPDLYAQVVAKELSANRAMILAGFRKELTPLERIRRDVHKLTQEQRH